MELYTIIYSLYNAHGDPGRQGEPKMASVVATNQLQNSSLYTELWVILDEGGGREREINSADYYTSA